MNINIKSSREDGQGTVYLVTKSISAFSWGEVGRVFVSKGAEARTAVFVVWEKRSKGQLTGTDQEEFSQALFGAIDRSL